MTLSSLQRNLYNLLAPKVDLAKFNENYNKLVSSMDDKKASYYTKEFVYSQGYIEGTPMSIELTEIAEIISKAGYKYPHSDIAWTSFNKVANYILHNAE